ncbi:hypothetical protein FXO38_26075 [Capsicum annuum]|nr:hypothetical protein FXO38_26075 [Capsicum annuum]
MFEKVFYTKFSGAIPFMNGTWPDNFKVSFEGAKKVVLDLEASLSNVTCRNVFLLYCMVKNYKINYATWFCEYMLESASDTHATNILSCRLLITQILLHYFIVPSGFPVVEVSMTYESKTFPNIGYVSTDTEWCKKESAKAKIDLLKEIKERLKSIEEGMMGLQESTSRLLQFNKDTSTDVGKMWLLINGLK